MIGWLFALGTSSTFGQNVRITDYDVPVSQSHRLDVNGQIWLSGIDRNTAALYQFNGRWEKYYHSLPLAWGVDAYGNLRIRKTSSRYGRPRRPTEYRETVSLKSHIHKYFSEEGLLFGGTEVRTSWRHYYKHVDLWVGMSAGLGRYVDATALAKALRIEQFLQKEEIIAEPLPKETILELASIIDREKEYKTRYGPTYPVLWYGEMEQTIIASRLVPNGTIGAIGILRMREVIERETVRRRAHGWKVEAGSGVWISRYIDTAPSYNWPFVAASFARPLGLRHQLSAEARVATPLEDDFGELYSYTVSLMYSFELSNRIDFIFGETYDHAHSQYDRPPYDRRSVRNNELGVSFTFYLENQLTLHLGLDLRYENERFLSTAGDTMESSTTRHPLSIEASVGYRVY